MVVVVLGAVVVVVLGAAVDAASVDFFGAVFTGFGSG